jgi:predicted LPLAT superfamily acyltransferase
MGREPRGARARHLHQFRDCIEDRVASNLPTFWVPRVRYSDPVTLATASGRGVGVPNPWHPAHLSTV